MTDTYDLLCPGEVMVAICPAGPDSLTDEEGRVTLRIGGAEGNVAVAAARLGLRSLFVSRLGRDRMGDLVEQTLRESGVAVQAPRDDEHPTAIYLKPQRPGEAPLYYRRGSAASLLDGTDVASLDVRVRAVHLTGITPALSETARRFSLAAVQLARRQGALFSFTVNYRRALWPDAQAARVALAPLVEAADLLSLNEQEARLLTGLDPEAAARALRQREGQIVAVTLGAAGAVVVDSAVHVIEPFPADLVDDVGAGDGFVAGMLTALLHGMPPAAAARLGAYVGARAVETRGDVDGYPAWSDVPRELLWQGA